MQDIELSFAERHSVNNEITEMTHIDLVNQCVIGTFLFKLFDRNRYIFLSFKELSIQLFYYL